MNFKFKGDRKYLHSTDIYKFFIGKKYKNIKITFKEKIHFQPKILKYDYQKNNEKTCCIIEYELNNKKQILELAESKKKIKDSYAYKETNFHKNFQLFKKSAKCNFVSNFEGIEVIVALNTFYHNKIIKKTNWYLSRIKLTNALDQNQLKKYTIKLKKNILNKFTTVDLYQDKKRIGEIKYLNND